MCLVFTCIIVWDYCHMEAVIEWWKCFLSLQLKSGELIDSSSVMKFNLVVLFHQQLEVEITYSMLVLKFHMLIFLVVNLSVLNCKDVFQIFPSLSSTKRTSCSSTKNSPSSHCRNQMMMPESVADKWRMFKSIHLFSTHIWRENFCLMHKIVLSQFMLRNFQRLTLRIWLMIKIACFSIVTIENQRSNENKHRTKIIVICFFTLISICLLFHDMFLSFNSDKRLLLLKTKREIIGERCRKIRLMIDASMLNQVLLHRLQQIEVEACR